MPQVLLVVIDALTARVVGPAMADGRLPTLQALAERGQARFDCRSIFPSITPAATSSIITGRYPCEHGIAGASWLDESTGEVAYYGDDFWTILREGTGHFFQDFLLHLNGERLTAPTLFEMVERTGRSAACLNYLVYRGDTTHRIHVPLPLALLPGVPFTETVAGPSTLCLGDFVGTGPGRDDLHSVGGMFHRFGLDDPGTAGYLQKLAAGGPLPDVTVAYFAENDYRSHKVGPQAALPVVERVDAYLRDFFDARGGMDVVLRDLRVAITGDHSHTEIDADAAHATLDLTGVLASWALGNPGAGWRDDEQIMICPNMRAAQIYMRHGPGEVERVIADLLSEPRVDQVLWRSDDGEGGTTRFHVATADRGRLSFAAAGSRDGTPDEYGGLWSWTGDLRALDAHVGADGRLTSERYPNPFERIAGGLRHPHAGHVWVTAIPGVELEAPGGGVHVGGASHGALHADDSIVPLIVAGGGAVPDWPAPPRTVDVAAVCLGALGIEPWRAAGESHAAAWR